MTKAIKLIEKEIEIEQAKLKNRGDLGLSDHQTMRVLGVRDGLQIALNIVKNINK